MTLIIGGNETHIDIDTCFFIEKRQRYVVVKCFKKNDNCIVKDKMKILLFIACYVSGFIYYS